MRIKTLLALILVLPASAYAGDTYVNGYMRSNGTYVDGHHKTSPNNTTLDNYSHSGNINPYTGAIGTRR